MLVWLVLVWLVLVWLVLVWLVLVWLVLVQLFCHYQLLLGVVYPVDRLHV